MGRAKALCRTTKGHGVCKTVKNTINLTIELINKSNLVISCVVKTFSIATTAACNELQLKKRKKQSKKRRRKDTNEVKLTGKLMEDLALGSFLIPEFILVVDKKLPENKRIYRKRKRQLVNFVKVTLYSGCPEEEHTIKKGTKVTVLGTKIKETGKINILKSLAYRDKEIKYKIHIIAHEIKTVGLKEAIDKQLPIISNDKYELKDVPSYGINKNYFKDFQGLPDDDIFKPVDEEDILFL